VFTALSTACPHWWMSTAQAVILRCRPGARRRFMTSCAVKASPLRSRLARLPNPATVTVGVADTAGGQTRQVLRWCAHPPASSDNHGAHPHPLPTTAHQLGSAPQPMAAAWTLPALLPGPAHARPTPTPATRLIRGRQSGEVFLSHRRLGPARRPSHGTCAPSPAKPAWARPARGVFLAAGDPSARRVLRLALSSRGGCRCYRFGQSS